MMRSNLILMSGNYPPETGGPAKFVADFSTWGSKYFDRVTVISTHEGEDTFFFNGLTKIHLLSRKGSRFVRYFKTALALLRHCDNNSVVLANGSLVELSIALFFKKMNVVIKLAGDIVWEQARAQELTTLDMSDFQKTRLSGKLWVLRRITLKCLQKADKVIVPSSALYEVCLNWGVLPRKLIRIPNGIDTELFRPIGHQKKEFDVLTVARLIEIKKIDELVIACSKLKLRLLIVGDGPELANLQLLSSDLGGAVEFFGRADQTALPTLYNKARVFVLNSVFEAGTPYAVLEARACGLWTIARENTGSEDIINHGVDGYLLGDKHKLGLIEALAISPSSEELGKTFSRQITIDTEVRFSRQRIYPQVLNVLMDVET